MATFTDFLVTVFATEGVPQTVQRMHESAAAFRRRRAEERLAWQQMRETSQATLGLAASMSGLGQAMYPVFFAFYRSSSAVQFMAARFLILLGVIQQTVQAFRELEQQQLKFQLGFAHAGLGGSADAFRGFAQRNQFRTGIGEAQTLGLAAELAQLRFNQQQITQLIPALQGAQLAGRGNPQQIASNLAKAITGGETAALVDLGLDVNKIKRSSDRAGEIISQMVEKFGKDAGLQLTTLGGQFTALASEWKSLLAEVGDILAPLIRILVAGFRHLLLGARAIPYFLGMALNSLARFTGLDFLGTQSYQTAEAIKRSGIARERQDSDNLRKIEQNTRELNTTLAQQTLGAAGAAVRAAATIRNYRVAVGVRG